MDSTATTITTITTITTPRLRRFLQSEYFDGDDESSNLTLVIIWWLAFFAMLLICIARKSSANRVPPREVILDQRRQQQDLIRRARLRRMGINPDSLGDAEGGIERIQLTAAQAEIRGKYLVQVFQSTNVQTVRTYFQLTYSLTCEASSTIILKKSILLLVHLNYVFLCR
jgi:hypothetical protein